MMVKFVKLILVICCMLTIFLFSNDNFLKSTEKSDGVIIKGTEFLLNRKLSKNERYSFIKKFVFPVRKSAHFIIYFILGILVISLFLEYRDLCFNTILLVGIFCFLYACSDEIHQIFVTGRSASIFDVFIDMCGSICGCLIYFFIVNIISRRRDNGYE